MSFILSGDIGGTKTRLALVDGDTPDFALLHERSYPSRHYASFAQVIADYLQSHGLAPAMACFGIAGPVQNNLCQATNLPWFVDGGAIADQFGWQTVWLLNDLEANAWGIQALPEEAMLELQAGAAESRGNRAIIAAGTGLGEAGMVFDGVMHHPFATEGGHADFSPQDEREMELLRFLRQRHGHVSWERIVCGPGLVNLHEFLCAYHHMAAPDWLRQQMRERDAAAAISRAAIEERDALCVEVLRWFVSLYGAEAGNLALKHMASGGLYIGGGIAPKILPFLQQENFIQAFLHKGRMQPLLEKMPVRVILDERTALLGPAVYAIIKLGMRTSLTGC